MSKGRKIWRIAWRLAVCSLLMFWIFHAIFMNEGKSALLRQGQNWDRLSRQEQWRQAWRHGPTELWRNLRQISPGAFALGTLVMASTIVLGVMRWRMALKLQGLNLSLGRTMEISFVAHFFNSFLLGSTGGDLMKAYYAARETHHKKPEAVATVMVDRLIGLWTMLLFAGLMILPNLKLLEHHEALTATAGLILAMLCGCSVLALLAFWGGLSRRWPNARRLLRHLPKGQSLERSLDSCREFGQSGGFLLKTFGLSMLLNLACVVNFLVLGAGLGLRLDVAPMMLIVPMVICIAALPITPSGLGVRENLFVLLLAAPGLDVPGTAALSLSLLAYAGSLFWSLVGGLVYVTLRDRHHLAEVAHADEALESATPAPKPNRAQALDPMTGKANGGARE